MITIEIEKLALFEREIIESGHCKALLPVTLIEETGALRLCYQTNGLMPAAERDIKCLPEMFSFLTAFVCSLDAVADALLTANACLTDPDHIFISDEGGDIKLVYAGTHSKSAGFSCQNKHLDNSRMRQADLLFGLIGEFGTRKSVSGAESAMGQLAEKLAQSNPGTQGLLKQIEHLAREWHYIMP